MEWKEIQKVSLFLKRKYEQSDLVVNRKTWSRADLVRGFIADIGSLSKLTMAADGLRQIPDFENKLGHEFADCLWSLAVLAHEYGIDVEKEFFKLQELLLNRLSTK